jgi:hypothetical protein
VGERGGVRAAIDAPPHSARLLLHVRRKFKTAMVNGAETRDCDFENGVVRLAPGARRYVVEIRY